MKHLIIELAAEEEKKFEYRMYQFQGLQIAINQFLKTGTFVYNEEHYSRLTESYTEKYRLFVEYILELLKSRKMGDLPVQGLDYEYTRGRLKVNLPQGAIMLRN